MAMDGGDFICAICLSLAYKPVVLGCGQVFCFWCGHDLLTGVKDAECPICRDSFHHLPRVCPLLHSLLMKIYSIEYKRRETEIREKESASGFLSQEVAGGELLESGVQVADVTCGTCKQLLVGPCVLNCGHVYCGMCIHEVDGVIRCAFCQHAHPGGTPKVCTELRNFLKKQFPEEYADREGLDQLPFQHEGVLPIDVDWRGANALQVHAKAGCDSCGMYPITGVRYRCMDCEEDVGFDLCEVCHETGLEIEGRFNQQHKPEHKFEILGSSSSRNTMLYLLRGIQEPFEEDESSEDEDEHMDEDNEDP